MPLKRERDILRDMDLEEVMGLVLNIQRFSLHDGPGIRTTVFLKGCPLRCVWCANPESQEQLPEVLYFEDRCIGCALCVDICSRKAITKSGEKIHIERSVCNGCQECVAVCPSNAIQAASTLQSVGDVMKEIIADEPFFRKSAGGVTISGGEPLMQYEFASRLLLECKARGLHTALDTSGLGPWFAMETVLQYVDVVLFDVKFVDSDRHKETTGVGNEIILNNLKKVVFIRDTWLRYPIIPGMNDSESRIRQIAELAKKYPFKKISLLPYHELGRVKYKALGREYPLIGVSSPIDSRLQELVTFMESLNVEVSIGY